MSITETVRDRSIALSWLKDEDVLQLSLGGVTILLEELRIRRKSNWTHPHEILGKGGSRIGVTDVELLRIISEYLRYNVNGHVDVDTVEHVYQDSRTSFSFRKKIHV